MDALKVINNQLSELDSNPLLRSLGRSQIIIEFNLDGVIVNANENFLITFGYLLEDVVGKGHHIFFEEQYFSSEESKEHWRKLVKGEFITGEYKMINKRGQEVWLNASYNPIFNQYEKVEKILMLAFDISLIKAELQVRTAIMDITSVVSESDLKGNIISINQKFCDLSQYSSDELLGKPHNTTRHPDMPKEVFKELWATIGRGNIFRGVVKNKKKDGTPYYVDAVIAPIMGSNGKPQKYLGVRYDITEAEIERHNSRGIISAIDSSFAYVEFDIAGNVLTANKNFLESMGYKNEEVVGKHHRTFVDSTSVNSNMYTQFWTELREGKTRAISLKIIQKMEKRFGFKLSMLQCLMKCEE